MYVQYVILAQMQVTHTTVMSLEARTQGHSAAVSQYLRIERGCIAQMGHRQGWLCMNIYKPHSSGAAVQ
jgi:hypothetical protein